MKYTFESRQSAVNPHVSISLYVDQEQRQAKDGVICLQMIIRLPTHLSPV